MALPASFARPGAEDHLNLGRAFSVTGKRRGQTRKIFVIKKISRLPSTNAAGKKIRRILIFDNHPDSLRLVFGRRANPHIHLSAPERVISWELILVSILIMGALIGTFWPLF